MSTPLPSCLDSNCSLHVWRSAKSMYNSGRGDANGGSGQDSAGGGPGNGNGGNGQGSAGGGQRNGNGGLGQSDGSGVGGHSSGASGGGEGNGPSGGPEGSGTGGRDEGARGTTRRSRKRRNQNEDNADCAHWDDEGRLLLPIRVDGDPRSHRRRGYSPGGFGTYPATPKIVRIANNL